MVGLASGGMESASNAPRGARVSDIRSRSEGTGQDSHGQDDQKPPLGKNLVTRGNGRWASSPRIRETCRFAATRCGAVAPGRRQCALTRLVAQAESRGFETPVTGGRGSSLCMLVCRPLHDRERTRAMAVDLCVESTTRCVALVRHASESSPVRTGILCRVRSAPSLHAIRAKQGGPYRGRRRASFQLSHVRSIR